MTQNTINLGPNDANHDATIMRGYSDQSGDYARTYVKYELYGVSEITGDDPYQIGGGTEGIWRVSFTNGEEVRIEGVISEVHHE